MPTKMKNIFTLLQSRSFRQRPAMYLGEKSITALQIFISGYFFGLDLFEIAHEDILRDFNGFVQTKYGYYESTAGWKNMILTQCENNEALAFDTFVQLFDEYVIQKSIKL